MAIFGIKFAPLRIPLERRLQTLAVACTITIIFFGGATALTLTFYLLVFTTYWWLMLMYLTWIWAIDKDTRDKGGRRSKWLRSWLLWRYTRDYFPLRLEKLQGVELDPMKNYLFCCFPHGVISIGFFNAFASDWCEFKDLFPFHKPHAVTLSQNLVIPFLRELTLGVGVIASSARSIDFVLGAPEGGQVCALEVGGMAEAYNSKPGMYRVILRHRKGFVERALRNGTPLVPVLSFGETDLFDQFERPWFKKVQGFFKKMTWVPIIFVIGRGFFQYSFGVLPRRCKVTTVVGAPIDVPRIDEPTRDQIDQYHDDFVQRLSEMFEQQKHNYLENPEEKHLEIE